MPKSTTRRTCCGRLAESSLRKMGIILLRADLGGPIPGLPRVAGKTYKNWIMTCISAIKVRPGLHFTFWPLVLALGLAGMGKLSAAWTTDGSVVRWQIGPKTVKLKETATLQLPAGFRFADAHSTIRVLEAANLPVSRREMGMIIPEDGSDWTIFFEFSETGHLNESGASSLNASELLSTLNRKIQSANAERKKAGKPPLSKWAWEQKPVYHASTHSLEWALRSESQSQTNLEHHLDFLGRSGVMEMKLFCDAERYNAFSSSFKEMLGSFNYFSGQRYSDQTFKSKVARGDLEGLITGETVRLQGKLGFWAAVLLVLKKILAWIIRLLVFAAIIAAVGAGYFFYKMYSGGKFKKAGTPAE